MFSLLEKELEAHPILNNRQLLEFDVQSKNIFWQRLTKVCTPRLSRPRYLGNKFNELSEYQDSGAERREVLVCHDMMDNYKDDRFYSGTEKWDFYKFYHWSGIDYFCYFSHKYITIPPASWVNAAHFHGVRVLGTYITEGGTGSQLLHEVLQSYSSADRISDALVQLCHHFCFDGWLINIECNVKEEKIPILIYFLEQLTTKIHDYIYNGVVFWYDSVIESGKVSWQNELNMNNIKFFNVCDGILINYSWNDKNLENTKTIILETDPTKLKKIFMGIDIFARGQVAKFQTNETLERIVQHNFSVGIFAPGWTYESIREIGYDILNPIGSDLVNNLFLNRNEKFWHLLWKYFVTHPISQLPFYTNFCLGSGKYTFEFGQKRRRTFFNLSKQALQPSIPLQYYAQRWFNDGVAGGCCLKITKPNEIFRLYTTNFQINRTMIFGYALKLMDQVNDNDEVDCVLRARLNDDDQRICELYCGNYDLYLQTGRVYLSPMKDDQTHMLGKLMQMDHTMLKLPYKLPNGWIMRYFLATFDKPIRIDDIGCCFRTKDDNKIDGPLLGAIYLHSLQNDSMNFIPGNLFCEIKI